MKLSGRELDKVLAGCARGDRECQEIIFKTYYGKMLGVSMRYTRSEELSKDLLQDSFIKIFDKIRVYNSKGSFEGWVRRIVVNTVIDHFRKKKNEFLLLDDDNTYDGKYDPVEEEEVGYKENIKPEMVAEALGKLSPAYSMVFNLYVIEGYSHQEIAEDLGISVGTSKSNLAKARQRLRTMLTTNLKGVS